MFKTNKFTIDIKRKHLEETKELYNTLKDRFQKCEIAPEDEGLALDALADLRRDIKMMEYELDEDN